MKYFIKTFFFSLLIITFHFDSKAQTAGINVETPVEVELAMVIAVLSGSDSVKQDGKYVKSINEYFEEHKSHPLFKALGPNFNLPRLAGNAADFNLDKKYNLIEKDTFGSIWGDKNGDLFRKNLNLIQDFAKESKFFDFYLMNTTLYQRGIINMKSHIDEEMMITWLKNNFSARPGPMQIIVSPLIGNLHWTTLFKPQIRIWLAPPRSPREDDVNMYKKIADSRSIFTELDHSYVNPFTKVILNEVKVGFDDLSYWAKDGTSASSYPTSELIFNEYMTWTVYLLFAYDMLEQNDFEKLNNQIIDFMANNRGFQVFSDFSTHALELYKNQNLRAEETMRYMAKWSSQRLKANQSN